MVNGRGAGIAAAAAAVAVAIMAGIGSGERARAQVESCNQGQYKLCSGDCPMGHTDQGECTTRTSQTPAARWCCCDDGYDPFAGRAETTSTDIPVGEILCASVPPPVEPEDSMDEKNDDGTWAASAAVAQTSDPELTDSVLGDVRDRVLLENERAQPYVEAVDRLGPDVKRILKANPDLVTRTAAVIDDNLPMLVVLARGQEITIGREKLQRVIALLDQLAAAEGASDDLRQVLDRAKKDLADEEFLQSLGLRVLQ